MNKIKQILAFKDLSEDMQEEIGYQLWEQYKKEFNVDPKITMDDFEYFNEYAEKLDEYIKLHFKGEIEY